MTANLKKLICIFIGIFFALSSDGIAKERLNNASFSDLDTAKASAEAANAALFAPKSFRKALEEYENFKENLQQVSTQSYSGTFQNIIRYFDSATQIANLAKATLSKSIEIRQEGANVAAPSMSPKIWKKAQQKFMRSIQTLERGNLKKAKKLEVEAITLYREAKLNAIKKRYLGKTWQLLSDAEKLNRNTPITLDEARRFIKEAENLIEKKEINESQLKQLIEKANFEINHAQYLSQKILEIKDKKISLEQILLNWEKDLWNISEIADIDPDIQEGTHTLTNKLISFFKSQVIEIGKLKLEIEVLQKEVDALNQEKIENRVTIEDMNEEMRSLDNQLIEASENSANLIQMLESQERIKEQFMQVENLFLPQEARIFRESDMIILRLFGLNFDSGTSTIKTSSIDLLNKVKKAINIFPQSEIMINGHTDSQGSIKNNQVISQDRAEAVRKYMIENMQIPSYQLIASGYGETKPVASNETEAGRARNRRIEIVINPTVDMLE